MVQSEVAGRRLHWLEVSSGWVLTAEKAMEHCRPVQAGHRSHLR